jgi:hypothetical protein
VLADADLRPELERIFTRPAAEVTPAAHHAHDVQE